MCSRLGNKKLKPNNVFPYKSSSGTQYGLWGFNEGQVYNARAESLRTVWKDKHDNRGVIFVESFWEGNTRFKRKDNKLFAMAVIYNDKDEFALVTAPANDVVKKYHHRMPLLLADDQVEHWLSKETNEVINFPEDQMIPEAA